MPKKTFISFWRSKEGLNNYNFFLSLSYWGCLCLTPGLETQEVLGKLFKVSTISFIERCHQMSAV